MLTIPLVDPSRPTIAHRPRAQQHPLADHPCVGAVDEATSPAHRVRSWLFGRPCPLRAASSSLGPPGVRGGGDRASLTDAAVAGSNLDEADLANQPVDLDFVAASLLEPKSPVRHFIDPSRVAVAGQSDGGETVLAASALNGAPGQPTFQAVIAMSVCPLTSAMPRNPPLLVIQGSADPVEPLTMGERVASAAQPPAYLDTLVGGGPLEPIQAGSRWFGGIVRLTDAFWLLYLDGRGLSQTVVAAGTSEVSSTVDRLPGR